MNARNLTFGLTLITGLILDQASKGWVVANLDVSSDEISIVPGWLSVVHAQNTGAAFSTMEGALVLFHVFTAVAVVVILDLARRQPTDLRMIPFSLGMILSGALGNWIDRARLGHVTDFIKVYAGEEPLRSWFIERFRTNVWPIFNVADSLLLVGVALFGLYWLLLRDSDVQADDEQPEAASP